MTEKQPVIAVVGPTASGKTALSIGLAKALSGEIISADSMQIYKGLEIASAAPTDAEMAEVPHHLVRFIEPTHRFSVAEYVNKASAAIAETADAGHLPIVVGGTGLYVDSVLDGYLLSDKEPDLAYRAELEKLTTPALYAKLVTLVPDVDVEKNNRNRVMRMLERIHDGDNAVPSKQARYDSLRLGISWERDVLAKRIDERLEMRLEQGMIE